MSSNPEPPVSRDPRRLRIGYAERDAVIETLRQAAGQGRITTDELEERIEAAAAAQTYLDLDPIVADLPTALPSAQVAGQPIQQPPAMPAPVPGPAGAPGHSPADPLVLQAGWNDEARAGDWQTVPFMRLKLTFATVRLNFTQARNSLDHIDIAVEGTAGACVIVVPQGWGVDSDGVDKDWGTLKNTVNRHPAPGMPLIAIAGALGMASLRIRYPNKRELKKLE